jgi:uncharacterized glyoxalase superfamily protein PhnB
MSTPAPSFAATSIALSLTVKNLEESVRWYRDVVGFSVARNIDRDGKTVGTVLTAGGAELLLNQDDGAKGWDRKKGEGLSIRINTDQNVDEIAARITADGGTLDREPADMPWGKRMFVVRDPDGYRLAFAK